MSSMFVVETKGWSFYSLYSQKRLSCSLVLCTCCVSSCFCCVYETLNIFPLYFWLLDWKVRPVRPLHLYQTLTFTPSSAHFCLNFPASHAELSHFLLGNRWKTGRRGNEQEERQTLCKQWWLLKKRLISLNIYPRYQTGTVPLRAAGGGDRVIADSSWSACWPAAGGLEPDCFCSDCLKIIWQNEQ